MAKTRSIIEFSGTLSGITFVDSKTYGAHARAKRGTYKPIGLNQGMKESAAVQTQVNLMAKVIFDAVKDFTPGFKDGKLWARLLSVFRQQHKAGKSYSYHDLNTMEMRSDYPSSKHGSFRLTANSAKELILHYQLQQEASYRISLLRIATDESLLTPYPPETLSFDVENGTRIGQFQIDFTGLPADANAVYVLQCEQLVNGKPTGLLKSKGVRFLMVE